MAVGAEPDRLLMRRLGSVSEQSTPDEESVEIRDAPEKGRYVLSVDGHPVGLVTYFDAGAQRVFLHTEVRPEFEGRGLAGKIARFALDDVRAQGRRVVNFCPYLKGFLERNHDWDDIVDRPTPAILDAVRSMQG